MPGLRSTARAPRAASGDRWRVWSGAPAALTTLPPLKPAKGSTTPRAWTSGSSAREQIVEQGAERLREGHWVTIFPEGTRIAPGKVGRYGVGGSLLATRTGTPVLPIAHNAGEYWPRYAFRKKPGTVKVVIGPLIQTAGRDVISVNNDVRNWIEGEMRRISPERYGLA